MTTTRKVQLTGTSTLSVSLPSEWVKRYHIKRGTQVTLAESADGSLLVRPQGAGTPKAERELALADFHDAESLRRAFLAAYLSGADVIRFHAPARISTEKRRIIVAQAHMLIGVEVTEETPSLIVVQDFFSHEGLSVSKTLKRAHVLTCSMFEQLIESMESHNSKEAADIVEKDDDVDRLRFLLLRQLNLALENAAILRELGLTAHDCLNYAIVIRNLEGVADKLSTIGTYYSELNHAREDSELSSKLVGMVREGYALYQQAVRSFLSKEASSANDAIALQKTLLQQRLELEKRLSGNAKGKPIAYQYSVMLDAVMDVIDHSTEIAEATIDSL